MKIVTVSREFGSGGRELGKRLAESLGCPYYDREIITAIAGEGQLDEEYVARVLDRGEFQTYPITLGRTLASPVSAQPGAMRLLVTQQRVVKELARRGEDCVIVGRGADVLLREYGPLNLFVYADMVSKIARCRARETGEEPMTDRELERCIRRVDTARARYRELITNGKWGAKENYHLCINTSGQAIEGMIPWLSLYVNDWFRRNKHEDPII